MPGYGNAICRAAANGCYAAKGTKSDVRSWGSVDMTSELGVSFHSDNYAKKQNIDGKTEQLIELVREHPHPYNSRLLEHMDAQLIHNTLGSIAEVLAVEKLCGKYATSYRPYRLTRF